MKQSASGRWSGGIVINLALLGVFKYSGFFYGKR